MPASPTARSALLAATEVPARTYGAAADAPPGPAADTSNTSLKGAAGLQRQLSDVECPPPLPEEAMDDPMSCSPPGVVETKYRPFREVAAVCLGLWTSVFCAALSGSVTANLQTDISSSFNAGHLASWLGGSYLLGNAAMTPLWGRLAAIIGRRQAILASMALFCTGTAGCALAPTMGAVLASRFISGCGGGGMLTVTAIIVSDLVSLAERGLYQGYVNLLFGAGAAAGAVFGGFVGDKLGWRWAFGMQLIPLSLSLTLIIAKVHVPVKPLTMTPYQLLRRIDWLGFVCILTSITALMLSLSLATASGYAFSHPLVWGLLALFALSTVLFVIVEHRAAEPLVPMSLLKSWTPALVLVAFLLLTMSTFARLFMIPLYLHVVRGYDGTHTGLILLPSTFTGSAASLYAGWHMKRWGKYKTLTVVSSVLPILAAVSLIATWGLDVSVSRMAIECALASWGGGVTITTFLTALIAACPAEMMPLAISSSYLFRSLGQVLGVALTGSVQQWALTADLYDRLDGVLGKDVLRSIVTEPSVVLHKLDPFVRAEAIAAYLYSIEAVFMLALGIAVAMTLCGLGMRSFPLPR